MLAEGANIGDWFIQGGKIVSTLDNFNKIILDARNGRIFVDSQYSGGDHSLNKNQGSQIEIDAYTGAVRTQNKKNNSRVAYMSPSGIFSNNAETDAISACTGITHKAAVVGLGFGNVNKADYMNENFIAGVYGRADNDGTAPAYGGFFENLMAAGLVLNKRYVESGDGEVYLRNNESFVFGYSKDGHNVYLPGDGVIGKMIFFKQWGSGYMRIRPRGGQCLYDDDSENSSLDIGCGHFGVLVFTIGYINNVKKEAWLFSRFKW